MYKLWISGFQDRRFLNVFPLYKSMELLNPRVGASLHTRVLIGRTYVGDHSTLLHNNIISCGPYDFREDFLRLSRCKSMETSYPWGGASLDPRSFIVRTTKYIMIFYKFSPNNSTGVICYHGNESLHPIYPNFP